MGNCFSKGTFRMLAAANILFISCFTIGVAVCAGEDLAAGRILDRQIISNLLSRSALVIVGEVKSQSLADRYGMALSDKTPFEVEVTKVLTQREDVQKKRIKVSVKRDEVEFRYPIEVPLIFFLKNTPQPQNRRDDPLFQTGDWRAVADYFGIIPHTLALERMIEEEAKKRKAL